MELKLPGFCGPTYSLRSINAACDRSINLYPEIVESGTGKNDKSLIGTPGLRLFASLGSAQPVRGICYEGGRLLAAGRSQLFEIDAAGAVTVLGSIESSPSDAPVTIVSNGAEFSYGGPQYLVVSNHTAYILIENNLYEIPDLSICQGAFLDGYFLGLNPNSRRVVISGLYDGMTWDPLEYKDKESHPDQVLAIMQDHGEVWIFGQTHSEVWYNSGNADFPLDRIPNARLEIGIAAPWSAAKLDNSVYWLGNDERGNRVVWRATGYTAVRVSNHGIENHINRFGHADKAIGWAYQEEGHSFYCLQFPNEAPNTELTVVFDAATGQWHERGWWDKQKGQWETHRARCHAFAFDKHLVGDRNNGKIYRQDLALYDDDGDRIRRIRIAPHLSNEAKTIFYSSFQLDLEIAVGLGMIDTTQYGQDQFGKDYTVW